MTDLQAALGLSQLQRLDQIVLERNSQLLFYKEMLADLPVQLLEVPEDSISSVHLAVIRLQDASAEQHRQVFEGLRYSGIGVQLHYSPVHLQPYYRAIGFEEGLFPEAEAYALSALSLPLFLVLLPLISSVWFQSWRSNLVLFCGNLFDEPLCNSCPWR